MGAPELDRLTVDLRGRTHRNAPLPSDPSAVRELDLLWLSEGPPRQHGVAERSLGDRVTRARKIDRVQAEGFGDAIRSRVIHLLEKHDIGSGERRLGTKGLDRLVDPLGVFDVPADDADTSRSHVAQIVARSVLTCSAMVASVAARN